MSASHPHEVETLLNNLRTYRIVHMVEQMIHGGQHTAIGSNQMFLAGASLHTTERFQPPANLLDVVFSKRLRQPNRVARTIAYQRHRQVPQGGAHDFVENLIA